MTSACSSQDARAFCQAATGMPACAPTWQPAAGTAWLAPSKRFKRASSRSEKKRRIQLSLRRAQSAVRRTDAFNTSTRRDAFFEFECPRWVRAISGRAVYLCKTCRLVTQTYFAFHVDADLACDFEQDRGQTVHSQQERSGRGSYKCSS